MKFSMINVRFYCSLFLGISLNFYSCLRILGTKRRLAEEILEALACTYK